MQRRPHLAVDQLERHAGQEDAIEESLQDSRKAIVPDRIGKYQRIGAKQAFDIRPHSIFVAAFVVVAEPFGSRQPWIETLGIKVAVIDRMARRREPLDDHPVQTGVEAGLDRMGVEHEDVHQPAFCSPLNKKVRPER